MSDFKAKMHQIEIARVGGHNAVQGHSRSLIMVPIKSPYTTSY